MGPGRILALAQSMAQFPAPEEFAAWERVGIVGILIAFITVSIMGGGLFIRALYKGQLWTERRAEDMRNHYEGMLTDKDEQIQQRNAVISDQQRTIDAMQRHAERRDGDFERVQAEARQLLHDVVMAGLKPPGYREASGE